MMIDAPGTVADRDDGAIHTDHGIGIQMGFHAPVGGFSTFLKQFLPGTMIKIEHGTAPMVVLLLAVVQQGIQNGLRDAALLQTGAGMLGHGCWHGISPGLLIDEEVCILSGSLDAPDKMTAGAPFTCIVIPVPTNPCAW
jgi:hypothetical protein